MADFASIYLSDFKKELDSGSEVDHNGHRFHTFKKGSIGREIQKIKEEKYIHKNKKNNSLSVTPHRPRISNFLDRYGQKQEEELVFLPSGKHRENFFCIPEHRDFIEQIKIEILHKIQKMPLYVLKAMEIFLDEINVTHILLQSNTMELFEKESKKSSSTFVILFVQCFYNNSCILSNQYEQRQKMSRSFSAMNKEDIRINNIRNVSHCAFENIHLSDQVKKIVSQSTQHCIDLLMNKKDELEERAKELTKIKNPLFYSKLETKPITIRNKESFKCNHRVSKSEFLDEKDDPRTLSHFDPSCMIRSENGYQLPQKRNPDEYFLPKRQRERIQEVLQRLHVKE